MWIELGAGVSTVCERRRNRHICRFTELTHARAALVGVGLRERRHFVCEVDMGECATANVRVSHDTVRIEVAVELVFAGPSSDTKYKEG